MVGFDWNLHFVQLSGGHERSNVRVFWKCLQFPGLWIRDPWLQESSELAHPLIHQVCMAVSEELRRQGLTSLPGCDMQLLGLDIQAQLTDPELRQLPVLAG